MQDDRELARLESVQNAVDQARCIAGQLTGSDLRYNNVPWFWSEQYYAKLQIAGLSTALDTSVTRGSLEDGEILSSRMSLTPEHPEDLEFDLKKAVARHRQSSSTDSRTHARAKSRAAS